VVLCDQLEPEARRAEHLKPEIAAERAGYEATVQTIAPEDLVFVDESGVTTSMVRSYARAPPGQRALRRAPAGRYERLTLLGAITLEGVSALMTIPAFTNRAVFRAFVERVRVPTLRPGQVVVLDNMPAHKYPDVEAAVRAAGCRLLFLPRYSPEYSPIEPCWSKVKHELHPIQQRKDNGPGKAAWQLAFPGPFSAPVVGAGRAVRIEAVSLYAASTSVPRVRSP
jgi:transposase